jgi:hypothetical protein
MGGSTTPTSLSVSPDTTTNWLSEPAPAPTTYHNRDNSYSLCETKIAVQDEKEEPSMRTMQLVGENRRAIGRFILALSLAPGLFSASGYAQTVANLTTPPNVTLTNRTLTVTGTNLIGTITNGGTITLNGGGVLKLGRLLTPAAVPPTITLTGGGPLTLAGGTLTGVENNVKTTTTLINVNNAITGTGTISTLRLNNQANINADSVGGTLTISNFGIRNSGTLQASLGGTLTLKGPMIGLDTVTNIPNAAGQGGSILAGQGGTVELNHVAVVDGFLDTQGTGVINATGDVGLTGLTVNGNYNVGAGTTTGISGRVRNNGTISVPKGGTLKGANLINGAKVVAAQGSTVALSNFTQTGGTLLADGSFQAPLINIGAGLITGTGTVTGALTMGGTFRPGDSGPGIFSLVGQYAQTASGILDEQLGGTAPGQFGQTLITGSANLGGLLEVSLFGGFEPSDADVFPILEASSGVTGFFADASPPGPGLPGLLQFSDGTFDVNYNVDFDGLPAVTLSNFTPTRAPEPPSLPLLGTGLIGLALLMRKPKATYDVAHKLGAFFGVSG